MASDHIPVVVTLSTFKPQEAPKKLPKWLVRHPLFRDILDPAISALYALDLNPWDRLGRIKNLMFEAAEEVRSQLAPQPAETTEAKHFRTLQAVRAWRAGDELRVRLAVRSYPALAAHFPSPDLRDAR
eukprot:8039912-Pyramimonas_sp.AAC.1